MRARLSCRRWSRGCNTELRRTEATPYLLQPPSILGERYVAYCCSVNLELYQITLCTNTQYARRPYQMFDWIFSADLNVSRPSTCQPFSQTFLIRVGKQPRPTKSSIASSEHLHFRQTVKAVFIETFECVWDYKLIRVMPSFRCKPSCATTEGFAECATPRPPRY